MSEPRLISPLLDEYIMGDPVSDHHGVRCCPAIKKETDEKYIVKILSIPASSVQTEALLLTGAYPTEEAVLAYFKELADSAAEEAALLQRLSKLEGFVGFDAWQIEPMEDGAGFDVYLIGEYRPTLERHLAGNPMTHLSAVNLGLDMCAALSVARQSGYLYVDLKPDNIVITGQGEYRVGDLGFIPMDSLKYASLPEKYRSAYTAPEITDVYSSLNATIDIYAAGLILYQAYNNGQLPISAENEPLPSPAYADYEIAEIILKACAENPGDRWQTPLEMGQALIGYLQRNDVTDTPIVPVPVAEEPESEETETAAEDEPITEETSAEIEEAPSEEDALAMALTDETTTIEAVAAELDDSAVTEEVEEMLAQADDLIAHETPDPVIPPDPIDVPIPPVILPDEETEETTEVSEDVPEETSAEESADEEGMDNDRTDDPRDEDIEVIPAPVIEEAPAKPRKSHKGLIATIAAIFVLFALVAAGYLFYEHIYTQTVNDITLYGSEDKLSVMLNTDIDNSLLTVVCSNTYGSSLRAPVENNTAQFTGLTPDTQYKITVEISGFHRLVGTTTDTYSTAPRTEVVSFSAITGAVDGSVILNFVVQGYDDSSWNIFYSAPGEAEKSVSFSGHMVTINGLTVGKEYTFRIAPVSTDYIVGNYTLVHKASNLIYAENLIVLGFSNNTLNVKWDAPADTAVSGWTVHCYNDLGFETTLTVTDTAASIPVSDPAGKYTVDVCANGMSQGKQAYVSANAITFTGVQVDDTTADRLNIKWQYEGTAPEGGWLVLYSINGSEPLVIHCESDSCVISALIPNSRYDITVKPASGVSTFGGTASYNVSDYGTFSGYQTTAADMDFRMCNTPNKANWSRYDVAQADYTNTFAVGRQASFVVVLQTYYSGSNDAITTRFVIRDASGNPIIVRDVVRTWSNMWGNTGYCYFDIPAMPQSAGNYTVDIYFNNAFVTTEAFIIQ